MTMLRLKALRPRQRAELSETLRDLANLAVAALGLGQFVGREPVSWWLVLCGLALWIVLVSFALVLPGEE